MKLGIAMSRLAWIGTCSTLTVAACSGAPVRSEDPSQYTDAITCESACYNLHRLHCESGANYTKCVAFCTKVQRSHYLSLPISCVIAARTKSEARACGTTCTGND